MISTSPAQDWLDSTVLSVSEYIDLTNEVLKPMRVTLQGEVTSVAERSSAVFFSLADPQAKSGQPAKIECVVWQYRYRSLPFKITPGIQLQVMGRASIYKASGKFSLVAEQLSPKGEGALRQAFEALKRRLEQQGLFDAARHRPIPDFPVRIGLVTSLQGDARNDFLTHLGQFGYEIIQVDTRVEGLAAVGELVAALRLLSSLPEPVDVIVVTRGGGSLESLQAFNTEAVAMAIAGSRVPVISAVGHENDVTIADLVADVRASTPTAAAKMLSESWRQARKEMPTYAKTWLGAFNFHLQRQHQQLERVHSQLWRLLHHHHQRLGIERQLLVQHLLWWQRQQQLALQLVRSFSTEWPRRWQAALQLQHQELGHVALQLQQLDPLRRLQQGYSLVSSTHHRVINSIQQLTVGETIQIQVTDGQVTAQVTGKAASYDSKKT